MRGEDRARGRAARTTAGATALAALVLASAPAAAGAATGKFSAPFAEPTIDGKRTDYKCIRREPRPGREPTGPFWRPWWDCKPAGGSVNVTPIPGRISYWNALESTENNNALNGGEYGTTAVNDQTRRLDLNRRRPRNSKWSRPTPVDGGANPPPAGSPDKEFLAVPDSVGRRLDAPWNDGSLFCADNNLLPDGRILGVGGSTYKNDPPIGPAGQGGGPLEVQGARNARI